MKDFAFSDREQKLLGQEKSFPNQYKLKSPKALFNHACASPQPTSIGLGQDLGGGFKKKNPPGDSVH